MTMLKDLQPERIIYQKFIIEDHSVIINWNNFYDHPPIDSSIKKKEERKMLTAEQGDNNTTGYLLDYDYIKNHYKLIAVDLSRHKK